MMIAKKSEKLLPLAERLRKLERKGLIESETMKLIIIPSPLPLPQGLAQVFLQEDRELLELKLLTFDSRLHDAAVGEGIAAFFEF